MTRKNWCGTMLMAMALATSAGGQVVREPKPPVVVDPELQGYTGMMQTGAISATVGIRKTTGTVNLRGPVSAVIFPVSYGLRTPQWTEAGIAAHMFGMASDSTHNAEGVAGRLYDASNGMFRLNGSMVFPFLARPNWKQSDVEHLFSSPVEMKSFCESIVRTWARRQNLSSYDNDGPDGLPASGDDDGLVDLSLVVIETDNFSSVATVPVKVNVTTGTEGKFSTSVRTMYVVALPRTTGMSADNLYPTLALLRAFGLRDVAGDLFVSGHPAGELSTLSRLELGWTVPKPVVKSGAYMLRQGDAYSLPILDIPAQAGMWLVERYGDSIYATRLTRRADGSYASIEKRQTSKGALLLPLTRTLGSEGPRATVSANGTLEVNLRVAGAQ